MPDPAPEPAPATKTPPVVPAPGGYGVGAVNTGGFGSSDPGWGNEENGTAFGDLSLLLDFARQENASKFRYTQLVRL